MTVALKRQPQPWSRAVVEARKQEIKEGLDAVADPEERLAEIRRRLNDLAERDDQASFVDRYILAMSALVLHLRESKLVRALWDGFVKVAETSLEIGDMRPEDRQPLVADLHHVLSTYAARKHRTWEATLRLMVGRRLIRSHGQSAARQALTLGMRLWRLGRGEAAAEALSVAASDASPSDVRVKALLLLASTQLHANARESAASTLEMVAALPTSATERHELQWAQLVQRTHASGDPAALIAAVGRSGSHYQPAYYLEAILWASAVGTRKDQDQVPWVRTRLKNAAFGLSARWPLTRIATAVQDLRRDEVTFETRTEALATALLMRSQLRFAEQELLLLAAAVRWFRRKKCPELATFIEHDYRELCHGMSGGASHDILLIH